MSAAPPRVSFSEAVRVWARVGLLGFGGPAGQIALMHRELVERRRWIGEERFLHALSYCTLLPGPEAQQLAIYVGWLLHRTAGGIVAGTLFVLPGFFAILGLSVLYVTFHDSSAVEALFFGLKAAVLAIVLDALVRIGRRALRGAAHVAIAVGTFAALFFLDIPFPLVVLGAALAGMWTGAAPEAVAAPGVSNEGPTPVVDAMAASGELAHTQPSVARAVRVLVVCGLLWIVPIAALGATFGTGNVLFQEGVFFSQVAAVTFGGAYAVLAYVAQRAVDVYGWLAPGEMLDGLGLAETTPGPLILVLQFVGFLGAYRDPGALPPLVAGIAGSLVTVWATFAPCFLWIFLGAPFIEALRGSRRLRAALSGVTAGVVGVIANLSVWFALHAIFLEVSERDLGPVRLLVPVWETASLPALVLTLAALVATLRFKVGLGWTLAGSAAAGLVWKLVAA